MRQKYGVIALDLNIFVSCEKHLEDHVCRVEGLRLSSDCLDSVANGLADSILAAPEETVLVLLNRFRGTWRLEECGDVLSQLVEELIGMLYREASSTSVAIALELQKLQRMLEQSQQPLSNPLLRRFVGSVERCRKKPSVREAIPDTVKCHDVIRVAVCMLEGADAHYAPYMISTVFCTRRNPVGLDKGDCNILCPVNDTVIVHNHTF
jgi:hypothetical protein